jgi:hypothetical protein
VSEHAFGQANEIGSSGLPGGEADDDYRGRSKRDVLGDRSPAGQPWVLKAKGAEEAKGPPE